MKKIFAIALMALGCMSAYSQEEGFLYEFAQADGTIIPDGSVVTITKAEEADDGSGDVMMNSGVFAKNIDGDETDLLRLAYEVVQKDNGDLQMCFPKECIMVRQTSGATTPGTLRGALHSIDTEWFPADYGTCVVRVRLETVVKTIGDNYTVVDDGPAITLRFVYADPDGISPATSLVVARPVARYSLSGRPLPPNYRGLAIVRLSDGRVIRQVVR